MAVGGEQDIRMPDPSNRTTAELIRSELAGRDYVDGQVEVLNEKIKTLIQRMDDRDEATRVLHETVTRVPTDMQLAIGHLKELMIEKFHSVDTQFSERDDRSKSEGVANEVKVNAAFAAQEKLAVQQNVANQTAITKSETTTNESIVKNNEAAQAANRALADKIDDIKSEQAVMRTEISNILSARAGGIETSATWKWAIGLGISLILFGITIVGFILANKPN